MVKAPILQGQIALQVVKDGIPGKNGTDANLLDWVQDWNNQKTQIDGSTVIAPKIFAGIKQPDGTLTGTAIGRFSVKTKDPAGNVISEQVDGLYGFNEGYKTFFLDNFGNAQLGYGQECIKYNATTRQIEFGPGVSMHWIGATYIDKDGIFTGTISAHTIETIRLDASQIITGTISAERIATGSIDASKLNAGSIKASIINTAYINSLSCTFTRGQIGGWNIGLTAISKNSISLGADGSITNRTKWKLNNDGSGQLASGNISWDTLGNVTFSSSVALAWKNDIEASKKENFGYPFYKQIIIYGEADKFYPVVFKGGDQAIKRNILIRRHHYEQAPWGTDASHAGSLILHIKTNFGNGGGTLYSWDIYDLSEQYTRTFAGAAHCGSYCMFAVFLRGGGETGAVYHLYSDQQIENSQYSPAPIPAAPQIAYNSDLIFQLGGSKGYAPAPRTLTPEVEEEIRRRRFISLTQTLDTTLVQHPLTYISSTGIYTGTLTASQVNAVNINAASIQSGILSANRIAAGSIHATKLDAASIRASIVNADYISGLTCNFTKGTIGGWSVGTNTLTGTHIALDNQNRQIVVYGAESKQSVKLYYTSNADFGLSAADAQGNCVAQLGAVNKIGGWVIGRDGLTGTHIALDNKNKRIAVYGANADATNGQRVQLYYNNNSDFGFAATDNLGNNIVQLGSVNKIAGWILTTSQIYKNNVSLGSDGTISNSTKWSFRNDGSGQIASGNISWDVQGRVSFSPTVALAWKNDIEAAKSVNFGYRYYKQIVVYGESDKYYPVVIKGGDQTVKRDILIRRSYSEQAPPDWDNRSATHKGGLILLIKANFGSWGGATYSWDIYELSECYSRMFAGAAHCGNNSMFAVFLRGGGETGAVYHIYSDQLLENNAYSPAPIPASPQIAYNSDLIFYSVGTECYAPAPRTLTDAVEKEIRRHHFINLAQSTDTTLLQHPLTYIGPTGIYTGTLSAVQVNAVNINASSIRSGLLSAERIAAGSIHSTKLDAASIRADIINTSYINGLNCTFTQGTLGGWTIGADSIVAGTLDAVGEIPIQIRSKSEGSGYWYNGLYKPYGVCLTWHQYHNAGHIVLGEIASSANTVKTGFAGIQMMTWDSVEYFCLSANYTKDGEIETYNRIAGWAFDHNHIWKNNVSLGEDGTVSNGTKWVLRNDGSGQIAGGNISWDSSGTVRFSDSVALNWGGGVNTGKLYVRGTGYNHPATNQVILNGVLIVDWNFRGFTLTVIRRSDLSVISNAAYDVYGNDSNCDALASAMNALGSDVIVVLTSYDAININGTLNEAIQRCGGSNLTLVNNRTPYALIGIPGIGKDNGLLSVFGSGASDPFAEISTTIIAGMPQGINLAGKQKTYLDGYGVYTGLVKANQVIIDSDLEVGGSSYNGSILVRDANNAIKVTLDRSGINAVGGKIGGFTIDGNQLLNSASDSSIRFSSLLGGAFLYINSSSALLDLRADTAGTGIRVQTYATGACGISVLANTGSKYAIESYGPVQFGQRGGERWNMPGVLYIGSKYMSGQNSYLRKIWGDGLIVTSFSHIGDSQYRVYHNLNHTDYTVICTIISPYFGYVRLMEKTSSYFAVQILASNGRADMSPFDFIVVGRNQW